MGVRDFTLKKYRELCEALVEKYRIMTVESYLTSGSGIDSIAILRHDVDRLPKNAAEMAKLESELGITSTYYFRMVKGVFNEEIIREIASLGHEIGYHYECVDKAKGNLDLAIKIFERELRKFREIVNVRTICMHGNPLTPWDNRSLWERYDFKKYDIIGEAYLSILDEEINYFSDTGRTWSGKYSLKDKLTTSSMKNLDVRTTDDVIETLKNEGLSRIYILTHPNRWSDNMGEWLAELISQNVKNVCKRFLAYVRNNG